MAFFKKMYAKLLGEEDESEAKQDASKELPPTSPTVPATKPTPTPTPDVKETKAGKAVNTTPNPSRSIELKIAKLTAFNTQVMEVADHLIAGRPVVLNLEGASKEATKRIIDFFSGVAYTIQGQLKTIATGIYIVTPSSVDVSNESLLASAATGAATPPTVPQGSDSPMGSASMYEGF